MSAVSVPESEPPVADSALPEDGPRLMLAPEAESFPGGADDASPDLLCLAAQADSLLSDTSGLFDGAHVRQRVGAVADLLRDAAAAVAAADAKVAAARAEASRVAARCQEEVGRLWRTVSADVATRRAATDGFVARALERAEREAEARLADASTKADLLLSRSEELAATWLDEANVIVARVLSSAPEAPEEPVAALPDAPPRRRRFLARLLGRP